MIIINQITRLAAPLRKDTPLVEIRLPIRTILTVIAFAIYTMGNIIIIQKTTSNTNPDQQPETPSYITPKMEEIIATDCYIDQM